MQIDDGQRFDTPSPALKAYLGQDINGWKEWVVERTGSTLEDLQ